MHHRPDLDAPVLILGLEGWVDAGLGSAQVIDHLRATREVATLATFDSDLLLDFRARRPLMRLIDGINTSLEWPSIELVAITDLDGLDTLLLVGAEPDARWGQFCASVIDLAQDFGVQLIATIGAYPSATPHTRPCRLTSTATEKRLLDPTQIVRRSNAAVPTPTSPRWGSGLRSPTTQPPCRIPMRRSP
jgi:proteasome assembly chaperone (PAC2) family protein